MSFSSRTKGELSRLPIDNRCCPMAELAAIVRMNSTIQINKIDQVSLKFNTENAAIARRIFILIKTLYNSNVEVIVKKNRQLKKNNKYMIVVKDRDVTKGILKDVGFLIDDDSYCIIDHGLPEDLVDSRCCRRSYIRGAFLGGGSISNPEKSYHMEFVTSHEE
ncbi:MAG TPA: DNA-binding protein WhiA, partial [Tepidimicrobium sp.]|nr:DNA-binding protein WhiA [Tepidimicrobium sp.]